MVHVLNSSNNLTDSGRRKYNYFRLTITLEYLHSIQKDKEWPNEKYKLMRHRDELGYSGRVSNSYSIRGTCRVTLVIKRVISYE
jgi:hypothetical protein